MSRELRIAPLGFDYPIGQTWEGYLMEAIPCFGCGGMADECTWCEGEGKVYPKVEPPTWTSSVRPGQEDEEDAYYGWQIWQTVSEGGPVSPVFASPRKLAQWMVENDGSITAGTTEEQWLAFMREGYSVGSMVYTPETGLVDGVRAVSELGQ